MAEEIKKEKEEKNEKAEKTEKKKSKKELEIEKLKSELDSKNDLLIRTAAEFDNYKNRKEESIENTLFRGHLICL